MNPLFKFVFLLFGVAFAAPSLAIPYQGQTAYRSILNGENILILSGTPNSRISFFAPNTTESYRYQGTDRCGWASVNLPEVTITNFKVNGTVKTPYSVTAFNGSYSCDRFGDSNLSGSERYNSATRTYFFKGSSARQAITFNWIQPSERRVRINDCGFGQVSLRNIALSNSIVVNGQSTVLSSLPNAPYPPLCRIVNNVRVPYVAQ